MNEYIELLRARGFGVVEDGSAVIVISDNERQERIGIKYTDSPTIAKRYESAKQAVQILLKGNEIIYLMIIICLTRVNN